MEPIQDAIRSVSANPSPGLGGDPVPELVRIMTQMREESQILSEIVDQLELRLSSVLHPEKPTEDVNKKETTSYFTEVAISQEALYCANLRNRLRIRNIIDRLEV